MSTAAVGLVGRTSVTLTGIGDDLGVVDRRDVRTRESQPYHDAVGLPLEEAGRLIEAALQAATARAASDLRGLVDDLAGLGVTVAFGGLIMKEYRLPASVEGILRSHTACHAAEGQMTNDALLAACDAVGIEVIATVSHAIDPRVEPVGKLIGPPWRKEQKLAASAALLALGD